MQVNSNLTKKRIHKPSAPSSQRQTGLLRLSFWSIALALLCWSVFPRSVNAELKPLFDNEMSEISGQAFVSINQETRDTREYMRLDIGMEINTQLNIDEIKLGEYPRWENGDPCYDCTGDEPGLEGQSADIWVKNLSLGNIAEYTGIHSDGNFYREGDIVPFQLIDPFLELVTEGGELVGFRAGVNKARGKFGGEILSLTGDLPVAIKDTASALIDAPNRPWWIALAGALLPRTPVAGDAALITAPETNPDGSVNYGTGGQPDPVRATHIGFPDNSQFRIGPIPFIGNINFNTTDCNLFGIPVCFPLTSYRSFDVGERQPDGTYEPTGGWFLSAQKDQVDWVDPVTDKTITAPSGFFFSVPVGGVELNLDQAFDGTPPPRVEYIDRGNNLF